MQFRRIEPNPIVRHLIECYWTVESDDPSPILQKIIPDGFPEIIFHFGDPYRIKLSDIWETQADALVAGQITKFFYLENSGKSNILGIKLKPASLTLLFDIHQDELVDQVVPIRSCNNKLLNELENHVKGIVHLHDSFDLIDNWFIQVKQTPHTKIDNALSHIFESNGSISIQELCEVTHLQERKLERLFKKYVGVSPKFYSRIIRFNYIFQLAKEKKLSWSELGLESGFYDQSHFIRNFKAFTGEDPTQYFFDEPTLANFFLKKEK